MKTANIYLSGGGVKSFYQARLINNIKNDFVINNIVGISMGALIGYLIVREQYEDIEKFALSLTDSSLVPCSSTVRALKQYKTIDYFCKPLIDALWLMTAIKYKGFYIPSFGVDFLDKIPKKNSENLNKFWCIVFNTTKNKLQIINGTHPLIEKYVLASCAIWLVFPPMFIEQLTSECACDENCGCDKTEQFCSCKQHQYNEFIDPGFYNYIPYGIDDFNIPHADVNIVCISGSLKVKMKLTTGDNLFEYMNNLIQYLSETNQSKILTKFTDNTYVLEYNTKASTFDTKQEVIEKIVKDGDNMYNKFSHLFKNDSTSYTYGCLRLCYDP